MAITMDKGTRVTNGAKTGTVTGFMGPDERYVRWDGGKRDACVKVAKLTVANEGANGMRWGYGRVSTRDQHTEAQHDALVAAGVDPKNIHVEKASTRLAVRPKLEELRKMLRPGDTIVVTKVDRIARSLLDLISIADDLRAHGVKLEVLSGTFNRDDPMGEAFFQMTGVFAQLERDLIRQRTNEGLEAARSRGRVGGRKAKLTDAQAAELRKMYAAKDKTVAEIGELFGISRESVYRYVKPAKQSA